MEKLDVAPPTEHTAAAPSADTRPVTLLKKYWDLLGVVLLMLGSFPTAWLVPRTVAFVPNLGLIDDNWHLDASFKALRGIWVGRDVAFTHGPFFQWLSSIPARSMPLSVGGLYVTWNTFPLWCAILFTYLTLRLLLPEQLAWKRFVLLLMLCSFWEASLRTTVPLFLFAVFLRGWYRLGEGRGRGYGLGILAALLCGAAFLIAGDTGVYVTAAWFISVAAIAVERARETDFTRKLLSALGAFVLASLVAVIAINAAMATPLNFKFWRDSFAQVAAYRWATPAAMTAEGTMYLLGAVLIGLAIFAGRAVTRRTGDIRFTQRTAFLVGGFIFALAMMQSALVRSDVGHVIIGDFAMIALASAILFSFRGRASLAGVVIALACSMLFSHPAFRPSSVIRLYGELRNPMMECPPGYSEFDRACYQEALTPQMLSSAAAFLGQHSVADDSIFVFPYQTMFGLVSRRNVAGGLMQAYTASGPLLSQIELSGLQRTPAAALYLPDADLNHWSQADVARWSRNYLSMPVDGIPNFTRTPEVWFWMVRHYRSVQQLSPGVVGLERDDSRSARLKLESQPLGLASRSYQIDQRESVTNLGTPSWPSGFDFLRLRLTVHYPLWWKLRKPERLQLEITRANGTRDVQWFLVQPNVATDVWFYPWDAPELANYFNADEGRWRPDAHSAITGLRLWATPLDWVSQQPQAITIDSADAVRLTLSAP